MAGAIATISVKRGDTGVFQQQVYDVSGIGLGPYLPLMMLSTPDGTARIDVGALLQSITDAIETGHAGPDWQASGLTTVTQVFTTEGSSAALAVKAGRDALLQVTGSGFADLQVEVMLDGANWLPFKASDGTTQVLRFQYAGVPFVTFLPLLPVAGAAYRITDLAHGSGTVSVRLAQ